MPGREGILLPTGAVYSDLRILCLGQGVPYRLHFDFMMACFIEQERIYSQCFFFFLVK